MGNLLFNVTTAALMVLMFKAGLALLGPDSIPQRRLPWAAIAVFAVALAGVVTQLCWAGAMDAFDADPGKSGWWRVVTSVFMQNGGFLGGAWNIATLAVVAALAQWFWGGPLMIGLFVAGILLPQHIDSLFMEASRSTDPRNFAGSSGATYFLAATLAAGLLLRAKDRKDRLLAVAAPVLGLVMWFAQENGHGLVVVYGFALGALVWGVGHRMIQPDLDSRKTPRLTMGSLAATIRR
ncbi:hypothetical protein OG785_39020 [Streptomyces sp. NBC_00006]|uniref:hypothetical protein n=1 Tax=unclassified Streptomyces TaxID=2593676 RepID=UPI002251E898|nr:MULTISPECIES: hypothetical protein [unclassified Streptomyces]MCX5536543.1 hypothetical protein [Streptomyces sp. NBC_00006]